MTKTQTLSTGPAVISDVVKVHNGRVAALDRMSFAGRPDRGLAAIAARRWHAESTA